MSELTSKPFWIAAGERAAKSAAQALVVAFGATTFDLWSADWQQITGAVVAMAVLSVATSIASIRVGAAGPSLTHAETTDPSPEYPADAPAVELAHREDDPYAPESPRRGATRYSGDRKGDAAHHDGTA